MALLGETPGLYKTGVAPDNGLGVVAPIYKSRFGQSGNFKLPQVNVIGLELEVGLVLDRDLDQATALRDELEIIEAIDYYFVGIEICGTRFSDRAAAGYNGGLSDGMSHLAYVMNPTHRGAGRRDQQFRRRARVRRQQDPFGSRPSIRSAPCWPSFIAYAKNQQPHSLALKAGTVVTTGSLCGLVPISGTGHVVGRLGSHTVEFDIV